jgi:hypothetical protein
MSKLKEFAEFVLEVEKNDGNFQFDCGKGWNNVSIDNERHALNFKYWLYGITRLKPKEEERKKIPLEFSDIQSSMVFTRGEGTMFNWSFANHSMVLIYDLMEGTFKPYDYENLIGEFEYSTDNGKTWKGCYKYED